MHAVMVARRSLLPWPVIRVKDSGMRAWQDMLMVRGLQLQEGCCTSLALLHWRNYLSPIISLPSFSVAVRLLYQAEAYWFFMSL